MKMVTVKNYRKMQEIAHSKGGFIVYGAADSKGRILLDCGKGHQWLIAAGNLISNKRWCPFCWGRRSTIGFDVKLADSVRKMGGEIIGEYKSAVTPIKIRCHKGHIWEPIPYSITGMNSWCPVCGGFKSSDPRGFQGRLEDFMEKLGGKVLEKYIGANHKIAFQCDKGHVWKTKPGHIINSKSWCPNCCPMHNLKREPLCRQILEKITGKSFKKVKCKWIMSKKGYPLELDGYCEELKIAFEHQGPQHFKKTMLNCDLLSMMERDEIKRAKCKEAGVLLIEIPYTVPIKKLESFILEKLKVANLPTIKSPHFSHTHKHF